MQQSLDRVASCSLLHYHRAFVDLGLAEHVDGIVPEPEPRVRRQ